MSATLIGQPLARNFGQFGVGRELRADGTNAVPGELLGPANIGAGVEVDGEFAGTADCLGADRGDANDRGDRLFERLRSLRNSRDVPRSRKQGPR